jgi:hypothetical protein
MTPSTKRCKGAVSLDVGDGGGLSDYDAVASVPDVPWMEVYSESHVWVRVLPWHSSSEHVVSHLLLSREFVRELAAFERETCAVEPDPPAPVRRCRWVLGTRAGVPARVVCVSAGCGAVYEVVDGRVTSKGRTVPVAGMLSSHPDERCVFDDPMEGAAGATSSCCGRVRP